MGKSGAFRVSRALKKLDRGARWLAEAYTLAKEGTLEALLDYCRVGYTSGNWHLPSIVTKYEHGIKHRLARLLEKELPKGYHFLKRADRPQDFILHFKGRRVAELNEYKRTITLYHPIEKLESELTSEIKRAEKYLNENKECLRRMEEDAGKIRRGLSYRMFGLVRIGQFSWIRRKTFEDRIARWLENARQRVTDAEKDWTRALSRYPKQVAWFSGFRNSWPDALSRLKSYGFKLNDYVMFEIEEREEEAMKPAQA